MFKSDESLALTTQQEFMLNSYIGLKEGPTHSAGDYVQVILDESSFNEGIKVLYLGRALKQKGQKFLKSLDKLYDPSLKDEAQTNNIEFIRALKVINDLHWNNPIQFDVDHDPDPDKGTRKALSRYFKQLYEDNPKDPENDQKYQNFSRAIKQAVKKIIETHIANLTSGTEDIKKQILVRIQAESTIARRLGWRKKLELPIRQQSPIRQAEKAGLIIDFSEDNNEEFDDFNVFATKKLKLTWEKCLQFGKQGKGLYFYTILSNIEALKDLIEAGHMTFENLLCLRYSTFEQILTNAKNFNQLVDGKRIILKNLWTLKDITFGQILTYVKKFHDLIDGGHIKLKTLSSLDASTFEQVLMHAENFNELMDGGHIKLKDFLKLENSYQLIRTDTFFWHGIGKNENFLKILLKNPTGFNTLMASQNIALSLLSKLESKNLETMLDKAEKVIALMREQSIGFESLVKLGAFKLSQILGNPEKFSHLLQQKHITLGHLSGLKVLIFKKILYYSKAFNTLMSDAHISLPAFLDLEAKDMDRILRDPFNVKMLISVKLRSSAKAEPESPKLVSKRASTTPIEALRKNERPLLFSGKSSYSTSNEVKNQEKEKKARLSL